MGNVAKDLGKMAALRSGVKLQPHQQRVVDRALGGERRMLLYHGLGTGKTLAAIAAADALGEPTLAEVPAALRPNFRGSVGRFTQNGPPVDVVSQTAVATGKRDAATPGTLVVDEAHRIRNPDTALARRTTALAQRARNVFLLSGSPIVNSPGDLAAPLNVLLGTHMTSKDFMSRYADIEEEPRSVWQRMMGERPHYAPVVRNKDELRRMLAGHVDYEKGVGAPGATVTDKVVDVDLTPDQARFNRLFHEKLPWVLQMKLKYDYPLNSRDLSRLTPFFMGSRMAALSTAPFGVSPLQGFHESAKLREAAKHLEQVLAHPRTKALIYSNFIDAGLKPYAAYLDKKKVPYGLFTGALNDRERADVLAKYNAGRLRALLIGPAAAEGVSTRGTQLIQLLDPAFNESRMAQVRGRGLRFDSHQGLPPELRNVTVERYVAHDTEPNWLWKMFGSERAPTADETLSRMAARKERLNDLFREELRRAGTRSDAPAED